MPANTTRDDKRDDEHQTHYRPTMGDLAHTHPETGESFGDAMVYQRGPVVVTDGGTAQSDEDDETLADVEHTPPRDAEDANGVHERGGEHEPEDDV